MSKKTLFLPLWQEEQEGWTPATKEEIDALRAVIPKDLAARHSAALSTAAQSAAQRKREEQIEADKRAYHEAQKRAERSKGGRARKYAKAIMAETERILRRARGLKAAEVFHLFPDERHAHTVNFSDGAYEVYRDGNVLVQIDPRGKERTIAIRSFTERYIPKARPHSK
jgi:hypothetical protein